MSTRRRFLVGLGRFAGAALLVPDRTIFDMGRGLIAQPAPSATVPFSSTWRADTTALDYIRQVDCETIANWMLRNRNERESVRAIDAVLRTTIRPGSGPDLSETIVRVQSQIMLARRVLRYDLN